MNTPFRRFKAFLKQRKRLKYWTALNESGGSDNKVEISESVKGSLRKNSGECSCRRCRDMNKERKTKYSGLPHRDLKRIKNINDEEDY